MVRRMPSVIKSVNGQIEKLAAESKGFFRLPFGVVRFNEDLHVVMLEQPIKRSALSPKKCCGPEGAADQRLR